MVFTLIFTLKNSHLNAKKKNPIFFQKSESFFPGWEALEKQNLEWGHLTVPENWNTPTEKNVKLAIAILKSSNPNTLKEPVVFLQGGPGGSTISAVWPWTNHPIRKDRDIILIDLRGTGFSEPRLCPDLGKEYLDVLAKNYSADEDIDQRIKAAINCKNSLEERAIDLNAYNSKFIAKDLNALKKALGYISWNVYGVSYGTRIALEYAREFPEDITNLVLDSTIPPNAPYYSQNTSNYRRALEILFDKCAKDPQCNQNYPELKSTLKETITKLDQNPLIVPVDKNITASKEFAFNSQDMMIAIHQGLYSQKLFEVLPLMIKEFNEGNKEMISALVSSLAARLSLDYGTYYCVVCNETIPFNSFQEYKKNNEKSKLAPKGLSFYKAEFSICEKWNTKSLDSTINKPVTFNKPSLIFSGEFDPITPPSYGRLTAKTLSNSFNLEVPSYGHGSSFSPCSKNSIVSFLNNPSAKPDPSCFDTNDLNFANNISVNVGVFKLAQTLQKPNFLKLSLLIVALNFLIVSVLIWGVKFLHKKATKNKHKVNREVIINRWIIGICSSTALIFLGGVVFAISATASYNFYILAFGLPNQFSFLFMLPYVIIICIVVLIFLLFKWNKKLLLQQKVYYSMAILSLCIFTGYLFNFGLLF